MKKQLIITSPTKAREINLLGEKPDSNKYGQSWEWARDLESWQAAEDALKEYVIVGYKNIGPYVKKEFPEIGTVHAFEINEQTKTCIIL